jgi:hypothetical protein
MRLVANDRTRHTELGNNSEPAMLVSVTLPPELVPEFPVIAVSR